MPIRNWSCFRGLATVELSAGNDKKSGKMAAVMGCFICCSAQLENTRVGIKVNLKKVKIRTKVISAVLFAALAVHGPIITGNPASTDNFDLEALEQKANKGDVVAQRDLGIEYLFGKHAFQDGLQAELWLKKAAEKNDAVAQAALGYLYEEGIGITKDFKEAARWYDKAAKQGHPTAQGRLGHMLKSGEGGKKDYPAALKWLQAAASWGDTYAQANLADMYERGLGVKQDYSLAATWYSAAASQNHIKAQSRLGYLYENGKGVNKDLVRAYMWYSIAGVWEWVGEGEMPDSDPRKKLGKKLTKEQMVEAETMATDWWIEHFQPSESKF